MHSTDGAPAPSVKASLRAIGPSVFLPAMVYEIGNGAIAPIIALTALDLGARPGLAGFILAFLGIGQILGDVPAAWLADRVGDRNAMIRAALLAMAAQLGCLFTQRLWLLALALLVIGASNATFYLARQSYVSEVVPIPVRARALSTLAGAHRIGLFIGPFAGALAIDIGGTRSAFVVAIGASSAAALLLIVIPDAALAGDRSPAPRGTVSSRRMLLTHRRLFTTLGLAVFAVGAVRAARQTVLPLWAEHVGLSAATTSIVFGVANAVDMLLFYPSGKVMDHFGRLWVALPAMLLLGGAMALLPLTRDAVALTVVAMTMSIGNGIGSGIMMTLGADAAPSESRIRFLSIWRLFSDTGNAAGPVIVSLVATATTLAGGIVAVGAVGLLAAAGLRRWVPRYSPYATRASMQKARAR